MKNNCLAKIVLANATGTGQTALQDFEWRFFIRLRRRPRALPVDECVTCASPLDVLKLVASADFASGG